MYIIAVYNNYWFNIVPLVLILIGALFFSTEKVLLYSVFLIPFSVPSSTFLPDLNFNVDLPTEPIFVCILLLFILKTTLDRKYDKNILKHPITIAILVYVGWRFITVLTSTMFLVSLKYWIASLWFIVPFFFMGVILFKNQKNIRKFFLMYAIALCCIIIITLIKHSAYTFSQHSANFIVSPFYNDHTSYGAAIAMFIPLIIGMIFNSETKKITRIILSCILVILIVGIIFSYTRAAWISLFGSIAMLLILKLKINYKYVLCFGFICIALLGIFQNKIFMSMEHNKQDSSTNFAEHVKSISNVATDASNLERINRWNCAVRMFKDKPIFGWGPGTYQFKYAPYQRSDEKTIISTNAGTGGNAHSEYLGSLAESGLFGMLNYLLVCLVIFVEGMKTYAKTNNKVLKNIIASVLCSIITYFIHGLLNNFLDIDKIAVPFWGCAAVIVAIDLFFVKNEENPTEKDGQA